MGEAVPFQLIGTTIQIPHGQVADYPELLGLDVEGKKKKGESE